MTRMLRRFYAVMMARNIEFMRDRSALAWNIIFPLIVIFGFGYMFQNDSQDIFKVALIGATAKENILNQAFAKTAYIQFVPYGDTQEALGKLRRHQVDMVYGSGQPEKFWINSSAPKGYLLEKILRGSSAQIPERQTVEGRETRYVDWLIAGLLAMNMMFSSLFGVGYNIVRYRKNGVLKRLKATPIHAFEFLLAQIASRLILLVIVTSFVFWACKQLVHFQMMGSYLDLFLVLVAGSICLIALGLLTASRIASEEFAGGLLNAISWPMMFLSGVWFSLEGAQPWVKKLAQIFPLTHVIDGARAIMNEGAPLSAAMPHIVALLVMSVIFLTVGAFAFKWE